MSQDCFYRLGKFIYQQRWKIISLWIVIILGCTPFFPHLTEPFKAIGFKDPNSESAKASDILNKKLGYSYNSFIVMFTNNQAINSDSLAEIKDSLSDLKKFPIKHQIIYPTSDNKQISKDKHAAYAIVLLSSGQEIDPKSLEEFTDLIKEPPHLTMKLGGEPVFLEDTKIQTQRDLYKTEYIASPVALITMLIVFGSVVAGTLPIVLGGITVFLILTLLFTLGHFFDLSVFTINIALLLGLCLSLDYALLIISRYRDEIAKEKNLMEALAKTQATAGKAVFFSGLAVFISLSALLLFPVNILFSVGVGGLAAVFVALMISLIFLPAILAVLNHRINIWNICLFRNKRSYWHWSVKHVVKRPLLFFFIILFFLLMLGYPFLNAKIGISNFRILPHGLESREVFDIFSKKFGENKLEPIYLIVQSKNPTFLTKKNIGNLYDLSDRIDHGSGVNEIKSIVNTKPRLSRQQYQLLYTVGKPTWSEDLKTYVDITTKDNLTVVTILSDNSSTSPETKTLIEKLRKMKPEPGLTVKLTGASVNAVDVKESIKHIFPYAFLWIIGFTYLILLIFLRSVILPLKAILTTMLSLCASYGVLVIVFQEGYFHRLLHFEPQGMLDITLLIIIFCALFGVSMDYEVFLLSRIKEFYEKTNDTTQSIVLGIESSSKIITSAAVIIILLCFAFMFADVLIVKAFGLGIAVSIFVDAFIIRTLFVPAIMQLLGKWNWYAPKWLKRILPKISFEAGH